MKIKLLKRYDKKWGGNKFSAFYGLHRFEYGGEVIWGLHLWPFYIEL